MFFAGGGAMVPNAPSALNGGAVPVRLAVTRTQRARWLLTVIVCGAGLATDETLPTSEKPAVALVVESAKVTDEPCPVSVLAGSCAFRLVSVATPGSS